MNLKKKTMKKMKKRLSIIKTSNSFGIQVQDRDIGLKLEENLSLSILKMMKEKSLRHTSGLLMMMTRAVLESMN